MAGELRVEMRVEIRGKKSQFQESLLFMAYIILAIMIFLGLMIFVKDAADDTLLEKTYYAKDISLLMTTISAAPGNLEYNYEIPEDTDLVIKIKDNNVEVDDAVKIKKD